MLDFAFGIDELSLFLLAVLCLAIYGLWRWSLTFHRPHFLFSTVKTLQGAKASWRQRWSSLPPLLMLFAFGFFILAFFDPHYFSPKKEEPSPVKQASIPTEGVAIYLVLDQSSSMSQEVAGRRKKMTKIDLLKQVTRDFVQGNQKYGLKGRPNDLLGLVTFARGSQVLSPLTLDHKAIIDQLEDLQFVTADDKDGTSIGYAIFKTANLIAATRHYGEELIGEDRPAYEIKSAIMILVTDGFQSPSPLDKGKRLRNIDVIEAAQYAKDQGIRLYMINVEPRLATEEFADYRKLMRRIVELTGGKFYLVDQGRGLETIYADIDRLEKSILPVETEYVMPPKEMLPHLYHRISFYPYLIAMGMLCIVASVVFEGVVMRKVP